MFYSDAFLTELSWQMLIGGYLTSFWFMNGPLDLDDLTKTNKA